jgi:hypothetical protein
MTQNQDRDQAEAERRHREKLGRFDPATDRRGIDPSRRGVDPDRRGIDPNPPPVEDRRGIEGG